MPDDDIYNAPGPSNQTTNASDSEFYTTLPTTSSSSDRWNHVDDYESLPQRFANTGWGRPSFFQNILNHTEHRHSRTEPSHPRRSPPPPNPFRRHPLSHPTINSPAPASASTSTNMPRQSSFIDLTDTPNNMPPQTRSQRQNHSFGRQAHMSSSPEAGPSNKRQRRNDGSSQARRPSRSEDIPSIDLSEDKPIDSTLQKQRADAIKAQEEPSDKPLRMSNLTCIICLETPTNLTVTSCGHWFCHTCIMEALIAGENRAGEGEARRSQCPVCRKTLSRHKITDVFPALLMKKGGAPQPTRKIIRDRAKG